MQDVMRVGFIFTCLARWPSHPTAQKHYSFIDKYYGFIERSSLKIPLARYKRVPPPCRPPKARVRVLNNMALTLLNAP